MQLHEIVRTGGETEAFLKRMPFSTISMNGCQTDAFLCILNTFLEHIQASSFEHQASDGRSGNALDFKRSPFNAYSQATEKVTKEYQGGVLQKMFWLLMEKREVEAALPPGNSCGQQEASCCFIKIPQLDGPFP